MRFWDYFRTDAQLGTRSRLVLGSLLFVLMIGGYLWASHVRHEHDPTDKVMPTPAKMVEGATKVVTPNDDGEVRLWIDWKASSYLFGIGLAVIMLAVPLGLLMGTFPLVEAILYRFLVFFDKIPAMALLPILFVAFGLGALPKIALIVLGVFPSIALDAFLKAKEIPREQFDKARSLGATDLEICFAVVLPQIWPKVLDTLRLNLKSMTQLLIAAESLAASAGLGYRIFKLQRFSTMEIIIPYVIFITVLMFAADFAITAWIRWRHRRWMGTN